MDISQNVVAFSEYMNFELPKCLDWRKKVLNRDIFNGGATVIPGATSIPESRVQEQVVICRMEHLIIAYIFLKNVFWLTFPILDESPWLISVGTV